MSYFHFPGGRLLIAVLGGILILMAPLGCSDDPAAPPEEVIDDDSGIHTDDGYVGVVIDTRAIFRKGYVAATVALTLPSHPTHGATLDVDPITNLAILSIDTDDLTEDELAAFSAGIALKLIVYDAQDAVLADIDVAELVLDNSNRPLTISSDLEHIRQPVALRQDLPYLIQIEGRANLMAQDLFNNVDPDSPFAIDENSQQFYFSTVDGSDYAYTVSTIADWGESYLWAVLPEDELGHVFCDSDFYLPGVELQLEQDEDGWVTIRRRGSSETLMYENHSTLGHVLRLTTGEPTRFRFISDHIAWEIIDRGTVFNQPIMPPAQLDFAYKGVLRNCSPGTLEEQIGRSEQRTRTTTFGTKESMQLFSSETLTLGVKIGFSVTAKIGVDVEGVGEVGEEVSVSEEISMSSEYTTSQTTSSENTWSSQKSTTTEVSRTRTITVPPQTAVEAYDAVKTIENVKVPFTQVLRITGTDKDSGAALTGLEVQSQMLFNFVGGVVTGVGDNYVDITFRGDAIVDQLFEATTNVVEIIGACD